MVVLYSILIVFLVSLWCIALVAMSMISHKAIASFCSSVNMWLLCYFQFASEDRLAAVFVVGYSLSGNLNSHVNPLFSCFLPLGYK